MTKGSLKKSVANALDIPEEIALDSARIILTGRQLLAAENHKGIVEYSPGKIVFKTAGGQAEVLGDGLTLAALSAAALLIEGEIAALRLTREDDGDGR